MEKLKEIWNNRKTRGIIFIIFYVILFSYIFIVYGGKSGKIILPENKPVKQEKQVINSYEYTYTFGEEKVNVKKYNDIVEFKIGDDDYYYINNKCYILKDEKFVLTDNPLKYNFDYLNNIDKLKEISTLVKTTKYADGLLEENYNINLMQFLNLFEINDESVENKMINYSIFLNETKISKILIDEIEIKYTNFENIEEININYEFYEGE